MVSHILEKHLPTPLYLQVKSENNSKVVYAWSMRNDPRSVQDESDVWVGVPVHTGLNVDKALVESLVELDRILSKLKDGASSIEISSAEVFVSAYVAIISKLYSLGRPNDLEYVRGQIERTIKPCLCILPANYGIYNVHKRIYLEGNEVSVQRDTIQLTIDVIVEFLLLAQPTAELDYDYTQRYLVGMYLRLDKDLR